MAMDPESALTLRNGTLETLHARSSCVEKIIIQETTECASLKIDDEVDKHDSGVDLVLSDAVFSENMNSDERNVVSELDGEIELGAESTFLDSETFLVSTSDNSMEEDLLLLSCGTPTKSIFDPFAPGPKELALAPKKKMLKGRQVPLRRQLNFNLSDISIRDLDSDVFLEVEEDDRFIELASKSLLDLIIFNQVQEASAPRLSVGTSPTESKTCMGHLLSGIGETCPAAPMKPTPKPRRLNQSICRKLDFGSDSFRDAR